MKDVSPIVPPVDISDAQGAVVGLGNSKEEEPALGALMQLLLWFVCGHQRITVSIHSFPEPRHIEGSKGCPGIGKFAGHDDT